MNYVKGLRNMECSEFKDIFMRILNRHAPIKRRYIRANNAPFMNKSLSKAIMVASKLRNKFLKLKTSESREAYNKQRNYCVTLLRESKKNFDENLNPNIISDNMKFWKHVKPFFSDKSPKSSTITIMEDDEVITDSAKCAEVMNNFFSDDVSKLDIDRNLHTNSASGLNESVTIAIEKYKNHPSILKLNENGFTHANFSFQPISNKNMQMVITNMDSSKAYQTDNIPPKILKQNDDICSVILSSDLNRCIENGKFPNNLKNAYITPTFKKGDRLLKSNYRPVSILPALSKIYEKLLYQQIYEYFNCIFSKYLCGFRKGHSTQHCLLFILDRLKKALDKGLCTGILLTDLSKAFDSISYDLLIAKLNAYGFSNTSLNVINDYLKGRKQRTKIGDSFSTWREIIYGFHKAQS